MTKENPDEYLSIKDFRREKILIKSSKFIATAFPISTEGEAKLFLEKIKREFYDATHNPFAYVLSKEETKKFSDDREPSGTAGSKILNAIESQRLKDVLVVVTRYFGGTKLGTGGLSRAYHESALKVLKSCTSIKKETSRILFLLFPKEYFDQVQMVLKKDGSKVKKLDFGERVKMEISFPESVYSKLKEKLKNITRGEIEFETGKN
ncbi:MAG: YigZ family protein [candidate division Zixibacteria bacterium]|nr:YigZ family protein [candidate division Zixibacteria bacterium]